MLGILINTIYHDDIFILCFCDFSIITTCRNFRRNASLLHHISRSTCLFVGLYLVDETLRHLLRQSARVNPGNFHYYIQWREAGAARNRESERAISEANFEVYNLITLFLDDPEISALGRLITVNDNELVHVAEEEGIDLRYVYYLTGAISAGKTTTLSYLASLETYEEWTDTRHELLGKSWTDLTSDQWEEIDKWTLPVCKKESRPSRPQARSDCP